MFTPQFVTNVLLPAAYGQPGWLAVLLAAAVRVWQAHPVAANLGAIAVQFTIGALFPLGREKVWGRVGLALAMGWGLLVWVAGEGLGGLLVGPPSALTGFPGSALVYVAGAFLLALPARTWQGEAIVGWTRRGLGGFWLLAALLQAWPGSAYWTSNGLGWLFQVVADQPQPVLLAAPISAVGALAARCPLSANTLFSAVMLALGIAFLSGRDHGWAFALGAVWLGFSWWMGQDFGSLFSGAATDPNAALPLGLLTLAVAPLPRWRRLGRGMEYVPRLSAVVATTRPMPVDHARPRAG
jgi:hypothetical protein